MLLGILVGYAIVLSVGTPAAFFAAGPVVERRALLGLTFTTVVAIGWGAAVLLGFLSFGAVAAAAAALLTLVAIAAAYAWQDERLLARFDARLGGTTSREEAIDDLKSSLQALATERRGAIALMELAGFAVRRLVAHGLYHEALELLDTIEARYGSRLGATDASEARVLRARVLLQLGRPEAASVALTEDRAVGTHCATDLGLLEGLLAACGPSPAARRRVIVPPGPMLWSDWSASLALLVRAHAAVARGDDGAAAKALATLRERPYGRATLELARTHRGPASELASLIERPSAPYR